MALVKKHIEQDVEELPRYSSLEDAIETFVTTIDPTIRDYTVDEIIKFHGGGDYLVEYINREDADKQISTKIASRKWL